MKPYLVLETLALRAKQIEQDESTGDDDNTRIIVAASLTLLASVAKEIGLKHQFDFENEIHKAFLLRAVYQLNPNTDFDEGDRNMIAALREILD